MRRYLTSLSSESALLAVACNVLEWSQLTTLVPLLVSRLRVDFIDEPPTLPGSPSRLAQLLRRVINALVDFDALRPMHTLWLRGDVAATPRRASASASLSLSPIISCPLPVIVPSPPAPATVLLLFAVWITLISAVAAVGQSLVAHSATLRSLYLLRSNTAFFVSMRHARHFPWTLPALSRRLVATVGL